MSSNRPSDAVDADVELTFSRDRTQVHGTFHPARNGGRPLAAQQVVQRLKAMGVVYGIRDHEIIEAIHESELLERSIPNVLVAQGVLPEHGTDAVVNWYVDYGVCSRQPPTRPDGKVDLFALEPERFVTAGQQICSVVPAHPGAPGKTLTAPIQPAPQLPGREAGLVAGPGVTASQDLTHFCATTSGYLEIRQDRIMVHPLVRIAGDLDTDLTVPGGLVVAGSMRRGGRIRAAGPVAIAGVAAAVIIRTTGDVFLNRGARCTIAADGDLIVAGGLTNSRVDVRGRVIAEEGSALCGGTISALHGVVAYDIGGEEHVSTRVVTGVDTLSQVRLEEIDEELRTCQYNIERISRSLRPHIVSNPAALSPERRALVQRLMEQRETMEDRIRELHGQKRTWSLESKVHARGPVVVRGTIYPGVALTLGGASCAIEQPASQVCYGESDDGKTVVRRPIPERNAA